MPPRLGTVMSSDGYILTKASEMDGAIDPEIILPGGRRFPAKELAADRSFDLALLKVDAAALQPASFRTDAATVGQLSLIQDAKGNALIPTVISVAAHTMERKEGLHGACCLCSTIMAFALVASFLAGRPTEMDQENDIIMSIAGSDVHSPEELIDRIGAYKPGRQDCRPVHA